MPIYELECNYCGLHSEHIMGMNDPLDEMADCPHCTGRVCRKHNIVYAVPMIHGDTTAGNWTQGGYFDEGLGEYVGGRKHRKEIMDKKGLEEYTPDPEMKKHRDEAKYIRSHATTKTPGARAAVRAEYKAANEKRSSKLMKESFDKSFKKMDAQ